MKGYNYVRFKRGYRFELDALLKQNRQDNNAIYFLEDTKEIYVDGIWYSSVDSFAELSDIDLTNANNGSLLVFNNGKWQTLPAPVFEVGNTTAAQLVSMRNGQLFWSPLSATSVEGLSGQIKALDIKLDAEVKDLEADIQKLDEQIELRALATEVYTKEEVEAKITEASLNLKFQIVESLESVLEPDKNTIYLVGTETPYDEYLYIDGKWEEVGNQEIDLSGYATKEDLEALPEKDTTYTFATGEENGTFIVTPVDGEPQSVVIAGLGSAAFANSEEFAASAETLAATSWEEGVRVSFSRGPQANLQPMQDGNFYLATDTDRLYVTVGDKLTPVTHGVNIVATVADLPVIETEDDLNCNQIYYVTESNILYIYSNGSWIQLTSKDQIYQISTNGEYTTKTENGEAATGIKAFTPTGEDYIFNLVMNKMSEDMTLIFDGGTDE